MRSDEGVGWEDGASKRGELSDGNEISNGLCRQPYAEQSHEGGG